MRYTSVEHARPVCRHKVNGHKLFLLPAISHELSCVLPITAAHILHAINIGHPKQQKTYILYLQENAQAASEVSLIC